MSPRLPQLPSVLLSSSISTSHNLLAAISAISLTSSTLPSPASARTIQHRPFARPKSLLPLISTRHASILSSLSDNASAYNRRIRRGRGPSSGKGKTSGRGHKGQKQHGKVPVGFQGGQTPLEIVHGKRGFENVHTVQYSVLNLGRLQSWVEQGRLPVATDKGESWVTVKELVASRCIHGVKAGGVKLLAGECRQGVHGDAVLKSKINIVVARASAEAIRKVEALGGRVITRYYGKSDGAGTGGSMRGVLRGLVDPMGGMALGSGLESSASGEDLPSEGKTGEEAKSTVEWRFKLPAPTSRKDIEYYRDERKRGYLSHLVPEGQGPSLFFKTPGVKSVHADGSAAGLGRKSKERAANRLF